MAADAGKNPKLVGTVLIDAIPQTGLCPNGCDQCFYNHCFYRTLDEPLLPSPEAAALRIVRVNSGHDSNIDREKVIAATDQYTFRFFNTSLPRFDFPAPVVFTCNGREPLFVQCTSNVMFVRIRANTWDIDIQDKLVDYYTYQGVPVVLTFMRYYEHDKVRIPEDYDFRTHINNPYWCPTPGAHFKVMARYKGRGVRMCGTLTSSLCIDCLNCVHLYWATYRRLVALRILTMKG